jgi:alpha-beta hydrolase superfamily lysophospholipase
MRRWLVCAAVACAVVGVTVSPASATPTFRMRVFRFVDHTRTIRLPDGKRVPRLLTTFVRIPRAEGRHPLVVFAHGFALTPAIYAHLLDAWARSGYVVAAPLFPLERADAPGGSDESDLINEPRDLSIVIDRLLALDGAPRGVLAGAIDRSRIAVAGHSDGAVAALAAAYDSRFRDPRVRAAIVLSGARLGGMGSFPRRGPPLLAMQGTADTTNPPSATSAYFSQAPRPKFLVWLLGASHLPPFTSQAPQLGIVERATTAFLAHYLLGRPLHAFEKAAERPGATRLVADP